MSRIHSGKSNIVLVAISKHHQKLNFVFCWPLKAQPLKFFRAQKDFHQMPYLCGNDWTKKARIRTKVLKDFVLSTRIMRKP